MKFYESFLCMCKNVKQSKMKNRKKKSSKIRKNDKLLY